MVTYPIIIQIDELKTEKVTRNVLELILKEATYVRALLSAKKITYVNEVSLFFQYKNKLFTFHISPTQPLHPFSTLYVWDEKGIQSLGSWSFSEPDIPISIINNVEKNLDHYLLGEVQCADCGDWISKKSLNRYFAGVYCDVCWNTKGWKEKEARETYD